MKLKVNVPSGHLSRVNQKLFDMDMKHSHQLGDNPFGSYIIIRSVDVETVRKVFGSYIIIRSVDVETVRKVFAQLELPIATKLLTK